MSGGPSGPLYNRAVSSLSRTAFFTLLLIACMMGANHVGARLAFDHGLDVATAVLCRSGVATLALLLLLRVQGVRWDMTPGQRRMLPRIGLLIAVQSLCLYAAVARMPVALALLAFNTYPLWTALWARLLYRERTPPRLLQAMPVMLLGLALALDVSGAASGLAAAAHWERIGAGVAFAFTASATFGLALVLTQHGTAGLDGRLRSAATLGMVALLASLAVVAQGGPHWPQAVPGWWGLVALVILYGSAFTLMFTVLPRLGVVGNSAIMNVEPIFALALAWALLGQAIAPVQVLGGLMVVGTVVWLGWRR